MAVSKDYRTFNPIKLQLKLANYAKNVLSSFANKIPPPKIATC